MAGSLVDSLRERPEADLDTQFVMQFVTGLQDCGSSGEKSIRDETSDVTTSSWSDQ